MDIKPYDNQIFFDGLGMKLWERRHQHLDQYIGIERILDVGCNDAKYIERLSHSTEQKLIVGLDIDENILKSGSERIQSDQIQYCLRQFRKGPCNIQLFQGDALKKYQILKNFDFEVITLIELIEHLYLDQLELLTENIFGFLSPKKIIITTPNSDFNIYFKEIDKNFVLRHPDHKYEFTRLEFQQWCSQIAQKFGYTTQFDGIGHHRSGDLTYGYASQICVFYKENESQIQYLPDFEEPKNILDYIVPYDSRTDCQKYIDYLLINQSRFSLYNQGNLTDYEYDLLDLFDRQKYEILRISDLPTFDEFDSLLRENSRFQIYETHYLIINNESIE